MTEVDLLPSAGPLARVRFLDIGHQQWEMARGLKEMPQELRARPPLAEPAGLFGIYPSGGGRPGVAGGWSRAAVRLFLELTQDKQCLLDVYGKEGDRLLVDLWTTSADSVAAISVKMTLLFCHHVRERSLTRMSAR